MKNTTNTTKTNLLQQLAQLSPEKRVQVMERLKALGVEVELPAQPANGSSGTTSTNNASLTTIPPIDRSLPIPLSFPQEQLWFLHQLEPESVAYNERVAIRLEGLLDVNALEQALHAVVRRHEGLRTTFAASDSGDTNGNGENVPVQIIHPFDPNIYRLTHQTMTTLDDTAELAQQVDAVTLQPFDLRVGPLWRLVLFSSQPASGARFHRPNQAHVLLLVVHHIIADAWSISILLEEIAAYYTARRRSESAQLPELSVTVADFAGWQRQQLQGERVAHHLAFWQQSLAGAPPHLPLPTDYPRPHRPSGQGAVQRIHLGRELTQQLKSLSREAGATLYMTLLSAFNVLLYRYTGQDDIVIGSVQANRPYTELEPLIGHFVNTLAIRSQLPHDCTFRQLLQKVRDNIRASYEHQGFPFQLLVQAFQPERTLGHHPLYQVTFNLHNQPGLDSEVFSQAFTGLTATPLSLENRTSKVDLYLLIYEDQEELIGEFEYNTDIFASATIKRMANHFEVLLKSIVSQPEQPVMQLPMLTDAEYHQIVYEWNDTAVDFGEPQTIHALFEQQVERTPDAIALVFSDQQLTYHELNRRANQLAHYLRDAGVITETPVGVCLNRHFDLMISILAIIKAGGAYVPLDPTYPLHRLQFMVRDTGLTLILSEAELLMHLPVEVQLVDVKRLDLDNYPQVRPDVDVTTDNLLYIMYTSGSTGEPKGIEILHRNVQRLINANFAQLDATQTFLQLASPSFDAATFEIWGSLCNGATLVLYPDQVIDLHHVGALIQTNKITILWLTAGLFHQMVDHNLEGLNGVRQLLAGGDVLSLPHIERLLKSSSKELMLINGYGPTENTTFTTTYRVADLQSLISSVPIGIPISNTQVYILDEALHPIPIGVPGELYTGGLGVARGYLNRPSLTAERFIEHPSFGRLYKTGDLCRWLPDGNIEFMGRTDFQVKIRGFRIELGEIESVLLAQKGIREAVVLARDAERKPSDARLVAYFVGQADTDTVRQQLAQRLPEYMIPSAFVELEAMPLTPNGKLDRRALPAPTIQSNRKNIHRPRTLLEQQLVQIWEETLGVHPIGIHDNFFEMGGHSLLAVQLLAKLQTGLARPIPLRILFAKPTVSMLAAWVAQGEVTPFVSNLVVIQPHGTQPPFYCLPGAGGGVLYLYQLAQAIGDDQPFYALESLGLDGKTQPFTTVEAAATYQVEQLRRHQPTGPYYLAGHSFGGFVAFEMAQQLHQAGATIGALVILDTGAPTGKAQPMEEVEIILLYERLFLEEYGLEPTLSEAQLAPLASEERLLLFKKSLEAAGIFPPNSSLEQIRGIVNVVCADLQAGDYLPTQYTRLPIQLFVATDDERDEAATEAMINGWSKYGEVTVHEVPGTHTTMMYEPHVKVLAQKLAELVQSQNGDK